MKKPVREVRNASQKGHFSLFDILVHLHERGEVDLRYHFDEEMDTHVIDAIDGQGPWRYQSYYSSGWYESNAFRMDMYPYKDETTLRILEVSEDTLAQIYQSFKDEVVRLARNGGQVIVPTLSVRAPQAEYAFENVAVRAHDVRSDVLRPGVMTALDALLSLGEQGKLSSVGLTWYERIGLADPVDSYWVETAGPAEAYAGCGFVYETGPQSFRGFSGSQIHIPADVRVTVAPEYALRFWICL